MSELAFNFTDMLQEIRMFEAVAANFLDSTSPNVLGEYVRQLEFMRSSKRREVVSWIIPSDRPLKTVVSEGRYESGKRRGGQNVVAAISTHWQIYCPDEGGKKGSTQKQFRLNGLASTSVKFAAVDGEGNESPLSIWQADVGDTDSPGCHFHIQVQREEDIAPYPSTFPIPRFPSILASPLAVAEFAISELFQTEWSRHALSRDSNLLTWSRIQRSRMEKLLSWQQKMLDDSSGSPLSYLKAQKPEIDLFV